MTAALRSRSLWLDTYPGSLLPRPPLAGDTEVDVAIVGGGYTGLWTAYYLALLDPTLRILVIEKEQVGFGASGRNGGWCVGELAGSIHRYAKVSSLDAGLRLWRAAFDAVDEVGRVVAAEDIRCGYAKGGTVRVARNRPQLDRQRAEIDELRELGITADELRMMSAEEARSSVNATKVLGGIFHAPSAALDPARLVRGLADACERRGVMIVEGTVATGLSTGAVTTPHGTVKAEMVVRATEAYTRDLPGERRTMIPVYSLMIATEPLAPGVFDEIGLAQRPTFADDRYMVIYGQRTEDNRLAFGGRGVPYAFGSRILPKMEHNERAHREMRENLVDLFPVIESAAITHRWGGVLGIPRDWTPAIQFDREGGMASAGGYVGEGVAAANLAGRTLADLITGTASERTDLPWIGIDWPLWEPEPLRFAAIRASRAFLGFADLQENRTQRESKLAVKLASFVRG